MIDEDVTVLPPNIALGVYPDITSTHFDDQ